MISTQGRRVISRHAPISGWIFVFVNNDTKALRMAVPADGPSFPIPPSGICSTGDVKRPILTTSPNINTHMQMDVTIIQRHVVGILGDTKRVRVGLYPAESDLSGFTDHLA